jgi:3-oxoacyl-[acyl-carrier protein] reductase
MMQISLAGRSALVSGGGRGIGRAVALSLASVGANVAISYRRDKDAAERTLRELKAMGVLAKAYAGSVETWEDDVALAKAVSDDFGPIGILVNNAGIAPRGKVIADTDRGELSQLMAIHALGPAYLCKLLLPEMRKQPRGDIIFISSVATIDYPAHGGPYNMAKSAMEALAFTLAKEERNHGIRANIVAPGLTATEMGSRGARATMGVSDIHELSGRSPFGRVSEPNDVASVVTWLVSDSNPYVNGQRIYVNGGG